ncbi:MAG TPA: hypothetical protein VK875_08295 [Euzebyales bacterium]|nr:hypothetical protein [Euzebyales bacterium]
MTVDASGTTAGLLLALARTDIDGVCTSTTIFFEPVEMPLLAMYSNGVRFVTGRLHVRTLLPEVIETITSGAFDPLSVDVRTVSWSDAVAALAMGSRGSA